MAMAAPEREQRPIIRTPLLIALLVTAAVGVVVGAYRFNSSRPVLAGEQHGAVGEVWLEVDEATGALRGEAAHVFHLRNAGREPVTILDVRSSCGCTAASAAESIIEPGDPVAIEAAMHLDRPGVREAEVFIHFDDERVQTLTLEAVGRSRFPLRAEPHRVVVMEERPLTVRVIAEVEDGDAQPMLEVDAPAGIEAELVRWSKWRDADSARQVPAMWSGAVRVSVVDDGALEEDAAIELTLDEKHVLRVGIEAKAEPRP